MERIYYGLFLGDGDLIEMVLVWKNKRYKVLIGIAGKFYEADWRLLWASDNKIEDNEGGANLEWILDKYHDSKKYDRLLSTNLNKHIPKRFDFWITYQEFPENKREVDPNQNFTKNELSVDVNNGPGKRQSIVPSGYQQHIENKAFNWKIKRKFVVLRAKC